MVLDWASCVAVDIAPVPRPQSSSYIPGCDVTYGEMSNEEEESMAEGVVENPPNLRYFCHSCQREISPNLPEFTCPQCNNGFVEQLTDENTEDDGNMERVEIDSGDPAEAFAQLWGRMILGPLSSGSEGRRRRGLPRARRISVRTSGQGGSSGGNAAEAAAIDLILQNLLGLPGIVSREDGPSNNQNIPFPLRMLQLHGNPGDYVWGTNGLDSIITQLLNQLEGTGPPPAENDKIEELPIITVNQELVDAKTECAVCQEQFHLSEQVKSLPCRHLYHKDCIEPWLKLHDSCPICRLSLSKNPTRHEQTD